MPFATVAGIEVRFTRFRQRDRERRGEDVRAFDNTLLAGADAGKRIWEGNTLPMVAEDVDALRAAIAAGPVPCGGDVLRGATVLCRVNIAEAEAGPDVTGPRDDWTGFNETLAITLREV